MESGAVESSTAVVKIDEEYTGPVYEEEMQLEDAIYRAGRNDSLPVLMVKMVKNHALIVSTYAYNLCEDHHYVREFCGCYRRVVAAPLPVGLTTCFTLQELVKNSLRTARSPMRGLQQFAVQ